jgi:hypothetical protein
MVAAVVVADTAEAVATVTDPRTTRNARQRGDRGTCSRDVPPSAALRFWLVYEVLAHFKPKLNGTQAVECELTTTIKDKPSGPVAS